jgi:23S rRNA pseudouridine1911/1915/1917 synthase
MAHMGCPLVGDSKYGEKDKDQTVGLALCSYRLSFTHPTTGKKMDFSIKPGGIVFEKFFSA